MKVKQCEGVLCWLCSRAVKWGVGWWPLQFCPCCCKIHSHPGSFRSKQENWRFNDSSGILTCEQEWKWFEAASLRPRPNYSNSIGCCWHVESWNHSYWSCCLHQLGSVLQAVRAELCKTSESALGAFIFWTCCCYQCTQLSIGGSSMGPDQMSPCQDGQRERCMVSWCDFFHIIVLWEFFVKEGGGYAKITCLYWALMSPCIGGQKKGATDVIYQD